MNSFSGHFILNFCELIHLIFFGGRGVRGWGNCFAMWNTVQDMETIRS